MTSLMMAVEDLGYSRTVGYTTTNHFSIITQRWGSVTNKVMPFCIANTLLATTLVWLQERHGIDCSISEFGHEFMSILVSFLVINKLSYTLSMYYELQGCLAKMNQSSIELVQLSCGFTRDQQSREYREWRLKVVQLTLTLLEGAVLVLYKGGQTEVWKAPDFVNHDLRMEVDYLEERRKNQTASSVVATNINRSLQKGLYIWGCQLKSDKNLRVPIRIAQRLRDQILHHQSLPGGRRHKQQPIIDTIQERSLLNCVQKFMDSYYGVRKYLTCPLPLPLVQLGRIFVMAYVFTLPFALLSRELNLKYPQMMALTWMMTYGFMGIELLYVELDNPFAEDPNDLPLTEEARAAGVDIFLSLFWQDGKEAVERLEDIFDTHRFYGVPPRKRDEEKTKKTHTESDPLLQV